MARARNIKPAFFMNDELAEIDPLGRLLFIGLWTIADREGRLEDRPARIKVETLPYDNCDVDELLNELAKRDFIRRYEVDGVRYIQVTNFSKHQNPHRNERQSEIPAPDLHSTSIVQAPDKDGAPSGVVWKSAQVEGKQKNKSAGLAGGIQVPEKHHTSTVQEPETHNTNRADSLLLNPDSLNTDSLIPGSSTPDGVDSAPKVARPRKSTIPDGFGISDRVRHWALENGHENLEIHLQSFVLKATAKGYKYVDWDAAFMNAIRDDWAKVSQNKVFEFKSSGQRRLENTDKAVQEFLGEQPGSENVIDGEFSHA